MSAASHLLPPQTIALSRRGLALLTAFPCDLLPAPQRCKHRNGSLLNCAEPRTIGGRRPFAPSFFTLESACFASRITR